MSDTNLIVAYLILVGFFAVVAGMALLDLIELGRRLRAVGRRRRVKAKAWRRRYR